MQGATCPHGPSTHAAECWSHNDPLRHSVFALINRFALSLIPGKTLLTGTEQPDIFVHYTSVQDGCILHADPGYPAVVGDDCVVGHRAVVHGCEIGEGCLVGMGATILNGAKIGEGSIVAAGALVPENKEFPPHSLIVGIPAKRVKDVSEEQAEDIARGVRTYVERAASHRRSLQRS